MPLQNRVTPFGEIVALPGRGLMMGNRGILHDDRRHIVRPSQVRRWIACRLEFKNIRRIVMRPHSYTELFFLDEATALSAGHRPCAECRRDAYRRFQSLWQTCNGAPAGADSMDLKLHNERGGGRTKIAYRTRLADLPDGTYVAVERKAWLIWSGELLEWSDSGYKARCRPSGFEEVDVLTPPSIVAVLRAGYVPGVHPSAKDGESCSQR